MMKDRELLLIYFGRLSPTKNIEVVIHTLKCLLDAHYNATLKLIGGCSEKYLSQLNELIIAKGIPKEKIQLLGPKPIEYIFEVLSQSHYFIFPSNEPKEGHSNALTEAMSMGVVPIVSNAGFNASICGVKELVVKDINPRAFAEKIMEIEESGRWKELSLRVYNRFNENYTEEKALEKIREAATRMRLI